METTIERVIDNWPAVFNKKKNLYYIRKQLHPNGIFFVEFRNDMVIIGMITNSGKDVDLLNLRHKDLAKYQFNRDKLFQDAIREANRISL